jgi:site-specific recombinase XerD
VAASVDPANVEIAFTNLSSVQCAKLKSERSSRLRNIGGLELKARARTRMPRHVCGYALANNGHAPRAIQGWLGHRSITSTAVYTALAPNRFKDVWR